MNILAVSDTHGNRRSLREIILGQGPFDAILHLGDGIQDGIDVSRESGLPFYGVRGNEDFSVTLPATLRLVLGSWTFLLLHGHERDMNRWQSPDMWEDHLTAMAGIAGKWEVQVLLFGHTHCPLLRLVDGIVICNPGDQYVGSTMTPTYAALDLSQDALKIAIFRREREGRWNVIFEHEMLHPVIP